MQYWCLLLRNCVGKFARVGLGTVRTHWNLGWTKGTAVVRLVRSET